MKWQKGEKSAKNKRKKFRIQKSRQSTDVETRHGTSLQYKKHFFADIRILCTFAPSNQIITIIIKV